MIFIKICCLTLPEGLTLHLSVIPNMMFVKIIEIIIYNSALPFYSLLPNE